jgi:hypothetical protein
VKNFDTLYNSFILEAKIVNSATVSRGNFYLLKEYVTINGTKKSQSETSAPILFILYVSKKEDILHAVKITDVDPNIIRNFFDKFRSKDSDNIEIRGKSKEIYNKIVSKSKSIKNEAYRTYKLSGIKKILEINMDFEKILPKKKNIKNK